MSQAQSEGLRRAWADPKRKARWLASMRTMWTPAKRKLHSLRMKRSWKRLGKARAAGCKQVHEGGVRQALLAEGYTVLKGGWPDFICIKGNRIRFVEAKMPKQKVSPHQKRVHDLLRRYGIKVEIIRR